VYLVQVWAQPGLDLPTPVTVNCEPPITIRRIEAEHPNGAKFPATLFEFDTEQADVSQSPEKLMRHIGKVLSRLSFSLLRPFNAFSARLVPKGLQKGDEVEEIVFPGPPPGIALFEGRLGFRPTVNLDPAFLERDLPPNVEGAITWFLDGFSASNPVRQVTCHWIGLETLAPPITGPWSCRECGADVPECPKCHQPTVGPRTVRTIRDFYSGPRILDQAIS